MKQMSKIAFFLVDSRQTGGEIFFLQGGDVNRSEPDKSGTE